MMQFGKNNKLIRRMFQNLCALCLILVAGCQDEFPDPGTVEAPSNLDFQVIVADDQSGNVTVVPSADNVINYHVYFQEGQKPEVILQGEQASTRFATSGQYSVPITVVAYAPGGVSSSKTISVDLDVKLEVPSNILSILTGGDGVAASTKRWVWNREVGGHFGVGSTLTNNFPEFFSAAPNQLNSCPI